MLRLSHCIRISAYVILKAVAYLMMCLLFVAGFVTTPVSAQEYNRGMIQLFGNEEGAAEVSGTGWKVLTKTSYTSFTSIFPVPYDGTTREYYVLIRKADNITDCTPAIGPEFRFWLSFANKPAHQFLVQKDWGRVGEGAFRLIKIPDIDIQTQAVATANSIPVESSTKYFRLEARMPAGCPASLMRVFAIYIVAIDKTSGTAAPVVLNTDPVTTDTAAYTIGGPGGGTFYFNNGRVGIGTKLPGATLAVNGDITAKKIKVTQTGWADFVFHPEYDLPSLQYVEDFIREHKHLPDMPTEAEVKADGLDIGEMNKKLLQKVEELTLHLIRVDKENQLLKQEVKLLKEDKHK